ncbi:MAG: hypothetical protein JSS87_06000 [Acidobacteria bacterium]|nr:hypothetical protein [Acidobacteriota bacterium]
MPLFDHKLAEMYLAMLCCITLGIAIFGWVGRFGVAIRWPARFLSVMLASVSSCLLLLCVSCDAIEVKQRAILYSPDGKHALVIRDVDDGALGGSTAVSLYSDHGLSEDILFRGDWRTTDSNRIRWFSNSTVHIQAGHGVHLSECLPTKKIVLVCQF